MRHPHRSKDRNSLPTTSEMKPLFRNLFVLAVSCPVWVARPAETLALSSEAASSDFVRLLRLPSPTITDSATPYRGGWSNATNILNAVQVGDGYEFAGGQRTGPRFDGHQPDIKIYAHE